MRKGLSPELIARVLGGAPKYTLDELEVKYPPRNLPDGAFVTRFAPSPTGYMHLGGLYQALIDNKLAYDTGGVFMLRIEDTDTKREVADAVKIIEDSMHKFGLKYNDIPEYGPYYQLLANIIMKNEILLSDAHEVIDKLEIALKQKDEKIKYVYIHMEPQN